MNGSALSVVWITMVLALSGTGLAKEPGAKDPDVKDPGAKDADVIPPEILKQMDPQILSGKRPIIETIRQKDIFALRSKPKIKADFVTFEFDVSKLSSVQREIMYKWIRGGHNTVYLEGAQIYAHAALLKPAKCEMVKRVVTKLLRHEVNTDTPDVRFVDSDLAQYTYSFYVPLTDLPHDSEVIVETDSGAAMCGYMRLDEGKVYFRGKLDKTPDSRRWLLNWWHWAMGLKVPGAADTRVTGRSMRPSTLAEKSSSDELSLRSGDTASGVVVETAFTIKTAKGTQTHQTSTIERIVFQGAGPDVDELTLKTGQSLRGVIAGDNVTVRLSTGAEVKLPKKSMRQIIFRAKRAAQPEPAPKAPAKPSTK